MSPGDLPEDSRRALLLRVSDAIEALRGPPRFVPTVDAALPSSPLDAPRDASAVVDALVAAMAEGVVPTGHPRYVGLYNAAASDVAVIADALVAAFHPQLATARHAPFPAAVERRLVTELAGRFGLGDDAEGVATIGASEANLTALLAALETTFPGFARTGLRALPAQPTVYVSSEAHPSIEKAARACGLGADAVRPVPCDAVSRMKPDALIEALRRDRARGDHPLCVVATLGTTPSGAIDPLKTIARICAREGTWLHVDAAWGGLAALVPELAPAVAGLSQADSIAFDAHKSLGVPQGAGFYLSRRRGALAALFDVRASYMPLDEQDEPYARSLQWSRRFLGLPLFATLLVCGWSGIVASLRVRIALGDRLRAGLRAAGFRVVNDTPLPVVCFVDPRGANASRLARVVVERGEAWLSPTPLASGAKVLRAAIVSPRTTEADVDAIVAALDAAR